MGFVCGGEGKEAVVLGGQAEQVRFVIGRNILANKAKQIVGKWSFIT